MSEQQIYAGLTDIFRDVFANQTLQLAAGTSAKEIEGWDSFAHINIIVAAEAHFGVRFRSSEAQDLKNVGDLVRVIQLKRS
jgi:acyl carrier protein